MYSVTSAKNQFFFWWRNFMNWGRPLPSEGSEPAIDRRLQAEVRNFLNGFDWSPLLKSRSISQIAVADVGARNFALATIIDDLFRSKNLNPQVHGFEIDAFRRMTNLRTRADYGRYYAAKIPAGFYHADDFLNWNSDLDVILLLHPFVKPEPLLSWGLPLSRFNPQALFQHCRNTLKERRGVLVFCSPTESEFALSQSLAERVGFKITQTHSWYPTSETVQSLPRLGAYAIIDGSEA